MAVTVHLPRALHGYAAGATVVTLDGPCPTVAAALQALSERLPAVTDRVLTEQGELRRHVNVFVGEENVRFLGGLAAPVPDGAALTIVPAVSGG